MISNLSYENIPVETNTNSFIYGTYKILCSSTFWRDYSANPGQTPQNILFQATAFSCIPCSVIMENDI